jgi:flavodoxin
MGDPKCLIAYYSRKGQNYVNGDIVDLPVGNTEIAALIIQATTGGDLLHLETVKEYPEDYGRTTDVAREELRQNARPKLKDQPKSVDGYDTVFLGYPNWCGTAPMPVFTFLESYDFSGKTIIPFCTHEGSGMGRSESDIRKACPGAKVLGGLAIRGGIVQSAEQDIRRWIEATGLVF